MHSRIWVVVMISLLALAPGLGCEEDSTDGNNQGLTSCTPGTKLPCKCTAFEYGVSYCNWTGDGWTICDCSGVIGGEDGGADGSNNFEPVEPYQTDNDTVMLWHLDEEDVYTGDAGVPMIKDSSGNGFDGQLLNGPTTGVPGPVDTAVQFDGDDDLIKIDVSSSGFDGGLVGVVLDTFTVEFWVWIQESGSGITVNRDGVGEESQVWQVGIAPTGQVVFRYEFVEGVRHERFSTGRVDDGWFHHVAATRDTATGMNQIYIDGELDRTFDGGLGGLSGTLNMSIGDHYNSSDYTDPFQGVLDEIRISSKVREPSEFNLP